MAEIGDRDWRVLEALQKGIPLTERPYADLAASVGMQETEFLERVTALRDAGVIRRMGFRLAHREAGVKGNVMVVWNVPEERLDEVGAALAASPAVSHCYVRPTFEGFPYNLYSMVHAPDMEAAERTIRELAASCAAKDYTLLRSVRELKKSTPVYRRPRG